ncbi:Phosphofurin acidic cluster sorting protein 2 [Sesbania bispinosa]|nr:Phosphofurin acidic cluster sorting protein 2 [Sesbania bispinosa]
MTSCTKRSSVSSRPPPPLLSKPDPVVSTPHNRLSRRKLREEKAEERIPKLGLKRK